MTKNSKILSIHCDEETPAQLSITSCSQNHSMLWIHFTTNVASECMLRIYSISGKLIFSKKLNAKEGENEIAIRGLQATAGIYLVNLIQDGKYASAKALWQ